MKKISSYNDDVAHFLVTPREMEHLALSVFLELEHEAFLKRARFSPRVANQYCVRIGLKELDAFLKYGEYTLKEIENSKRREQVFKLLKRLRKEFFSPGSVTTLRPTVVELAQEELAYDERLKDPAYQKCLAQICQTIEEGRAKGVDFSKRYDPLECYFCNAYEDFDETDFMTLLNEEGLVTGHHEMTVLEHHEDRHEDKAWKGYIITYVFICPVCGYLQTSVWDAPDYPEETQ